MTDSLDPWLPPPAIPRRRLHRAAGLRLLLRLSAPRKRAPGGGSCAPQCRAGCSWRCPCSAWGWACGCCGTPVP